jgi:succinyl-CoA synthetase alpha subunit
VSIFIDGHTALVQGITGRDGSFHTYQMIEYGTQVVGGVTPGQGRPALRRTAERADLRHRRGGGRGDRREHLGHLRAAAFAADAIIEAADAGVSFIVCITEGVPVLDMTRVTRSCRRRARGCSARTAPASSRRARARSASSPATSRTPGPVGLVSRSGTLTYEVVYKLTQRRHRQTTCVGIGGDPINGTSFIDCLEAFEADPETKAVVMIGEIGGTDEQDAAASSASTMSKPVVGFIAGQTAPPGRRMGHAGAIISGSAGTAEEKIQAFEENGIGVAKRPLDVVGLIQDALGSH